MRERLSSDKKRAVAPPRTGKKNPLREQINNEGFSQWTVCFHHGGPMRHGAAAYVKRCILHQQENLKLWLLAVLQVTHLIGTGSSANYIPNTVLKLVALMDTHQKWREFWKGSSEQSSRALSTQEAHGPHLGFLDQNEILIGISGNTSVHHNPTIFSQNERQ